MSQWSSFKEQQTHFDRWRSFINEGIDDTESDPSIYHAAGLKSAAMEDSLINFLKNIDELTDEQKQQLIGIFFQYAEKEDILLEAIGDSGAPNRTFSAEATAALQSLLNSFDLGQSTLNRVERAVNQWANINQIKFTTATAAKPVTTSSIDTRSKRKRSTYKAVPITEPKVAEPEPTTAPEKKKASPAKRPKRRREVPPEPLLGLPEPAASEKKPSREEKAAAKKERISTIKAAKTLDALNKLVPLDKDHPLWVLIARDERRGEIKRAEREEKKEIAAILNIKRDAPDDVLAPEPGSEDEFQSAAKAASQQVVPAPETEKDVKVSSKPIEDVPPAEKKKIRTAVTTGKKRVAATIDYKTKEDAAAAVLKVYQKTAETSVGGVQKYDIPTQGELEKTIVNVIRAIRDKRNPRAPREIIKTEFGALGKTIPPAERIQDVIEKSLNISIDDDKEMDKMELDIASWAERSAALGLREQKELEGTKTVRDYINESHEEKFNKLLKAFVK